MKKYYQLTTQLTFFTSSNVLLLRDTVLCRVAVKLSARYQFIEQFINRCNMFLLNNLTEQYNFNAVGLFRI